MKFSLFLLLLIYSSFVFSLKIIEVKNAQLQNLYLYDGSSLRVYPEDGVTITVRGKATRQVKLEIKTNGAIYLTPGVRITELRPKNRIITLDKYGEGEFAIGFSLQGETAVSGKYKKPIKYEVNYVE